MNFNVEIGFQIETNVVQYLCRYIRCSYGTVCYRIKVINKILFDLWTDLFYLSDEQEFASKFFRYPP